MDRIYKRADRITFSKDEENLVTLQYENKGIINRIFQLLFKKPKISYIHLDKEGSFVWCLTDGKNSVSDIIKSFEINFPQEEKVETRVIKYIGILKANNFIQQI